MSSARGSTSAYSPTKPSRWKPAGMKSKAGKRRVGGSGGGGASTRIDPVTGVRTSHAAQHLNQLMAQMYETDLFDALRPYLREEKIFMDSDNWQEAPIRTDMLKALARKWKFHLNIPNFWKTYNTRQKLARVLSEYIVTHQEAFARTAGDGSRAVGGQLDGVLPPLASPSSRSSKGAPSPTGARGRPATATFPSPMASPLSATRPPTAPSPRRPVRIRSFSERQDAIGLASSPHHRRRSKSPPPTTTHDSTPPTATQTDNSTAIVFMSRLPAPAPVPASSESVGGQSDETTEDVRLARLIEHFDRMDEASQSSSRSQSPLGDDEWLRKQAQAAYARFGPAPFVDPQPLGTTAAVPESDAETDGDTAAGAGNGTGADPAPFPGGRAAPPPRSFREQCARAMREVSVPPPSRPSIIQQGAFNAIISVLGESSSLETRLDCGVALAQLSAVQPVVPGPSGRPLADLPQSHIVVIPNSMECPTEAVSAICRVAASLDHEMEAELRILLVTTLYNFSCNQPWREKLASSGVVSALLSLMPPRVSIAGPGAEISVAAELAAKGSGSVDSRPTTAQFPSELAESFDGPVLRSNDPFAPEFFSRSLLDGEDVLLSSGGVSDSRDSSGDGFGTSTRSKDPPAPGGVDASELALRSSSAQDDAFKHSQDSYILQLCIRALSNISTCRAGSLALVESRATDSFAQYWYWLPSEVKSMAASFCLFNMARLPHYLPRVANAGGVIVLADVIETCKPCYSPFHTWCLRRAALALCSLTMFTHTISRVIRGGGVRALVDVVSAIVAATSSTLSGKKRRHKKHKGSHSAGSGGSTNSGRSSSVTGSGNSGGLAAFGSATLGSTPSTGPQSSAGGITHPMAVELDTLLSSSRVLRKVALALARCLNHATDAALAASEGACGALASMAATKHRRTRRICAIALTNAFSRTDTLLHAVDGGSLSVLARCALAPVGSNQALYALCLYNASCNPDVCRRMLSISTFSDDHSDRPASAQSRKSHGGNHIVIRALLALIHSALASIDGRDASGFSSSPPTCVADLPLTDGSPAHPAECASSARILSYSLAALRNVTAIPGAAEKVVACGAIRVLKHLVYPRDTLGMFQITSPADAAKRASNKWLAMLSSRRKPSAATFTSASAAKASVARDTKRPLLPVSVVADAIHCLANLSTDGNCRHNLVHAGLLPMLIPIVAQAPSSSLALAKGVTLRHNISCLPPLEAAPVSSPPAAETFSPPGSSPAKPTNASKTPGSSPPVIAVIDRAGSPPRGRQDSRPSILSPSAITFATPVASHAPKTQQSEVAEVRKMLIEGVPRKSVVGSSDPSRPNKKKKENKTLVRETERKAQIQAEEQRISELAFAARDQCALGLCNLACSAAATQATSDDKASRAQALRESHVLESLVALCHVNNTSHDDGIRIRVAQAFEVLSEHTDLAEVMIRARVHHTVVALSSSNLDLVRRSCARVLYNLTQIVGLEPSLVEAGVVLAVETLALLRSHDPITQVQCVECIHNLLANPSCRLDVANDRVIWALQRLSASEDPATQRACAVTMYRLATDPASQPLLVRQGGLKSVFAALNRHLGHTTPSPRSEHGGRASSSFDPIVGSLYAGVLARVSQERGYEEELVRDGAVRALVSLCLKEDEGKVRHDTDTQAPYDPETASFRSISQLKPSCALGLYNLASSNDLRVREKLIDEGGMQVFVNLSTSMEETMATRRLAVMGLSYLLGVPSRCGEVFRAGAGSAMAHMSRPESGGGARERYAAVLSLHYAAASPDLLPLLFGPSLDVANDMASAVGRVSSAYASMRLGIESDIATLAASILAEMSLFSLKTAVDVAQGRAPADALERCEFRVNTASLKAFCKGVSSTCQALQQSSQRNVGNATAPAPYGEAEVDPEQQLVFLEKAAAFLSSLCRNEATLEVLIASSGIPALNSILVTPGLTLHTAACSLVALRALTSDPETRPVVVRRGGSRLIRRLVSISDGDHSATVASPAAMLHALGKSSTRLTSGEYRQYTDDAGLELRFAACRVLCNMVADLPSQQLLLDNGVTRGLLAVSDHPHVPPELRQACLRAMCNLAVDSDAKAAAGGSTAAALSASLTRDDLISSSSPVPSSPGASTPADADLVATGAVAALIAVMGTSDTVSSVDIPADLSSDLVIFRPSDEDVYLLEPPSPCVAAPLLAASMSGHTRVPYDLYARTAARYQKPQPSAPPIDLPTPLPQEAPPSPSKSSFGRRLPSPRKSPKPTPVETPPPSFPPDVIRAMLLRSTARPAAAAEAAASALPVLKVLPPIVEVDTPTASTEPTEPVASDDHLSDKGLEENESEVKIRRSTSYPLPMSSTAVSDAPPHRSVSLGARLMEDAAGGDSSDDDADADADADADDDDDGDAYENGDGDVQTIKDPNSLAFDSVEELDGSNVCTQFELDPREAVLYHGAWKKLSEAGLRAAQRPTSSASSVQGRSTPERRERAVAEAVSVMEPSACDLTLRTSLMSPLQHAESETSELILSAESPHAHCQGTMSVSLGAEASVHESDCEDDWHESTTGPSRHTSHPAESLSKHSIVLDQRASLASIPSHGTLGAAGRRVDKASLHNYLAFPFIIQSTAWENVPLAAAAALQTEVSSHGNKYEDGDALHHSSSGPALLGSASEGSFDVSLDDHSYDHRSGTSGGAGTAASAAEGPDTLARRRSGRASVTSVDSHTQSVLASLPVCGFVPHPSEELLAKEVARGAKIIGSRASSALARRGIRCSDFETIPSSRRRSPTSIGVAHVAIATGGRGVGDLVGAERMKALHMPALGPPPFLDSIAEGHETWSVASPSTNHAGGTPHVAPHAAELRASHPAPSNSLLGPPPTPVSPVRITYQLGPGSSTVAARVRNHQQKARARKTPPPPTRRAREKAKAEAATSAYTAPLPRVVAPGSKPSRKPQRRPASSGAIRPPVSEMSQGMAATRIQAAVRSWISRSRTSAIRARFVLLQRYAMDAIARMKAERGEATPAGLASASHDIDSAATKVQRVVRGKLAREDVKRLRELYSIRQDEAASKVQALARGARDRRQVRRRLEDRRTEHNAASKVQALARGKLARSEAKKLQTLALIEEDHAAARIQAGWRGKSARQEATSRQKLTRLREDDAASKLQAVARGRLARREASDRRHLASLDREHAASRIQALQRGHVARTSFRETRVAHEIAEAATSPVVVSTTPPPTDFATAQFPEAFAPLAPVNLSPPPSAPTSDDLEESSQARRAQVSAHVARLPVDSSHRRTPPTRLGASEGPSTATGSRKLSAGSQRSSASRRSESPSTRPPAHGPTSSSRARSGSSSSKASGTRGPTPTSVGSVVNAYDARHIPSTTGAMLPSPPAKARRGVRNPLTSPNAHGRKLAVSASARGSTAEAASGQKPPTQTRPVPGAQSAEAATGLRTGPRAGTGVGAGSQRPTPTPGAVLASLRTLKPDQLTDEHRRRIRAVIQSRGLTPEAIAKLPDEVRAVVEWSLSLAETPTAP